MRVHSIFPVKANDLNKMKCILSPKFTSADMSATKSNYWSLFFSNLYEFLENYKGNQ